MGNSSRLLMTALQLQDLGVFLVLAGEQCLGKLEL